MSNDNCCSSSESVDSPEQAILCDPDCMSCLREKLRALCVIVFFRIEDGWRIGGFQGDRPLRDAEVHAYALLTEGVPELVASHEEGFILSNKQSISDVFGSVGNLFDGCSVLAAPVRRGRSRGVRLAWRDAKDPFTEVELETIRCFGECPHGCEPVNTVSA